MRFNIRDVLWLTAVIACLVCWYLERDGRMHASRQYVATFEANKRLEAELALARAAHVNAQRELERLSHERFVELQKQVEELRKAATEFNPLEPIH